MGNNATATPGELRDRGQWDQYHRSRCRRPTTALPAARSTAIVAGLLRRISLVNASTYSSAAPMRVNPRRGQVSDH